jgi:short-subunit dehydrogenase
MVKLECKVLCVDIDVNQLKNLETYLKKKYSYCQVYLYEADIRSLEAIKTLSTQIKSNFDHIDILINNAGIMNQAKLFLDTTDQDIQNIFNVNVLAHMYLCKQFLPGMIKNKKGHIVNVSSALGI